MSGERNGNPLQYSCLENPTDGGAWWSRAHWVAKSWTLSNFQLRTFILHVIMDIVSYFLFGFIKTKNACSFKDTVKRIKIQVVDWNKKSIYLAKDLYPENINKSHNLKTRK